MRYKNRQGPVALFFVKSSKGDHLLLEIEKLPIYFKKYTIYFLKV